MKRNSFRKYSYFLYLAGILAALCQAPAEAALFDAAEYLQPGHFALGINGDLLLNNPSGEALEARVKGGVNDLINLQGIIATGNKNRKFKFGLQSNINFFPDIPGQIGLTMLVGGAYVRRVAYNGVQILVGPMVHHNFGDLDGKPVNIFVAVPFTMELHDGTYTTASQLAFGGLYDLDSAQNWYMSGEAGLSLRRAESYISIGGGLRFGAGRARINRRHNQDSDVEEEYRARQKKSAPDDDSVKTIENSDE